jgi:predicted MFS family arabinose efflux permease
MILGGGRSRRGALILLAVCVIYFIENFLRSAPSALSPVLVEELKLSGAMAGLLMSSYSFLYALMQVPSGVLSVGLGSRRTILGFMAFSVVGVFLFYLGRSWEVLIAAQLLIGLGFSVFYINAVNIVSRWFSAERRASAVGVLSATSGLGNFSAYLGFPLFIAIAGEWRMLYLCSGLLLLASYFMSFIILKDSPSSAREVEVARRPVAEVLMDVVRNRRIYALLAGYVLASFSWVFLSWLPKLLVDTRGLSYLEAGLISSVVNFAGIPGCMLIGLISDRLRRRKLPLAILSASYTVLLGLFLILPVQTPLVPLGVVATAIGFSVSLWALPFSMVSEMLSPERAGMGLGLMNGVGMLSLTLLSPVYGFLVDLSGSYLVSNAMIMLGGVGMTLVFALFAHETYGGVERT